MPGVPEQPKHPKPEENKSETDPSMKAEDIKKGGKDGKEEGEEERPMRSIEELRKDPKAVVHCDLQDELNKEFEQKGLDFSKPKDEGAEKETADNKEVKAQA